MPTGAITGYIDVAQLVLYGFWIFFAGLIIYLRREDKREGYPLESDRSDRAPRVSVVGFPKPPEPKQFLLPHDQGTRQAPRDESFAGEITGTRTTAPWDGSPLLPTGEPMLEGVGPASYANREDVPDLTLEGNPKVVPMRVATDFIVEPDDPDPRGMAVVAADGQVAGTVKDLWVDRSEPRILFFEVQLADEPDQESAGDNQDDNQDENDAPAHFESDSASPDHSPSTGADEEYPESPAAEPEHPEPEHREAGTRRRTNPLLPYGYARVKFEQGQIRVSSIMADQFQHVPRTASADQITRLEEDRITAYFSSGHLYAHPSRQEPLI